MKNVHERQLRKCILMPFEDFKEIIEKITEGIFTAVEYGEIYIENTGKETFWNGDIIDALSEYFDVTVIDFHADSHTPTGVWICYKE